MPLVSDSPALARWLHDELIDSPCVCDLGAGFFDKLRFANPMSKKVGLEVFPPYLGYAPPGMRAVCGDVRAWEKYIREDERHTAMLIDVIEHMSKDDGLALLKSLKEHFQKILVMTPDGYVKQDEDVTGFENEWQVHECGWTEAELQAEEFTVHRADNFHPHLGIDALFATWKKE